jgi:hypothetical protein
MQLAVPSFVANRVRGFSLEFPAGWDDGCVNKPATPLNDAQFGGYFFARIWR